MESPVLALSLGPVGTEVGLGCMLGTCFCGWVRRVGTLRYVCFFPLLLVQQFKCWFQKYFLFPCLWALGELDFGPRVSLSLFDGDPITCIIFFLFVYL